MVHTHFPKGKLVRIGLNDGQVIIGRYQDCTNRLMLVGSFKILKKDIASASNFKQRNEGQQASACHN
jgi:hypothetical protein